MESSAIVTNNLSRSFDSIKAVDRLSIEIPTGTVFGFLGPNGAGKTTTINLLLGLLEPTGGSASVLGFDVQSQSSAIRCRTGALLEHNGLYERLSAEENLEFYGRVWQLSAHERRTRIHDLLSSMGLWERRKEMVGTWSRGMKQKLAVARTLLHRPALVFLDEPTVGLDPVAAASLRTELADLTSREGLTVFLTTHNLSEAERLCDRIGIIQNGQLVVSGSTEDLLTDDVAQIEVKGRGFSAELVQQFLQRPEVIDVISVKNNRLRINPRDNANVTSLVNALVNLGAEVEEVATIKSTLEDVFLELVEEES